MKIIADDKIPFLKGILEPYAEVIYLPGRDITREKLLDCDALLIRTRTECTTSLLKGIPLKFIGTATIGYDHIDTRFCKEQNIMWTNAPGCNSSSVQQYMIAALLKIAGIYGFSLKGKTMGIIGAGNVGKKVEKFARLAGMNLLINDPPRARRENSSSFSDLPDVLRESDIITLHVPLNISGEDRTYHLIGKDNLMKIKEGAWLINTSRGEVIDTAALKYVIRSGRLGGVVLDVWENEPDIDVGLIENIFLATPHIAGYSADGKANGTSRVVNALCDFFNIPLNNWYPSIPSPPESIIKITGNGKHDEDILREVVSSTYNIDNDDKSLREHPGDFEKLRGDYGLRREFQAYTIELNSVSENIIQVLKGLYFNLQFPGSEP